MAQVGLGAGQALLGRVAPSERRSAWQLAIYNVANIAVLGGHPHRVGDRGGGWWYLKVIWSATEWGGASITTTGLARRMGTTAPNVTSTLKRLAGQGLVEYTPYRPVVLTCLGERYAVQMVRRHRLLQAFLVTSLGYRWEEVHEEAERLEHAVSGTMVERISAQRGHPEVDPHGDPIPTAAGEVHRPAAAVSLAEAPGGEYVVVRVSDSDPGVLVRLRERGVCPGARLSTWTGGTVVRVHRGRGSVRLSAEDAAAAWVLPSGPTG